MIKIAKMKKADVDAVADLWIEFIDHHAAINPVLTPRRNARSKVVKNFTETIRKRKKQVFVARDGERIVGYTYIYINKPSDVVEFPETGYISDLAVTREYWKHGVGAKLYKESIKWFKSLKIKRVELLVIKGNTVAEKFWTGAGYETYVSRMYKKI